MNTLNFCFIDGSMCVVDACLSKQFPVYICFRFSWYLLITYEQTRWEKNTNKQKRWSEVDGDGDNKYKKKKKQGQADWIVARDCYNTQPSIVSLDHVTKW